MSNEYKDWRREEVLEHLPEGWEYRPGNNIDEDRIVKGDCVLSLKEAYEIQFKEYNRGYDSALQHIINNCNKELLGE